MSARHRECCRFRLRFVFHSTRPAGDQSATRWCNCFANAVREDQTQMRRRCRRRRCHVVHVNCARDAVPHKFADVCVQYCQCRPSANYATLARVCTWCARRCSTPTRRRRSDQLCEFIVHRMRRSHTDRRVCARVFGAAIAVRLGVVYDHRHRRAAARSSCS